MTAPGDKCQTDNTIVSLPRQRGHVFRRTIRLVCVALVYLLIGALFLYWTLSGRTATVRQRIILALATGFAVLIGFVYLVFLRLAWKRAFAIHQNGIDIGEIRLSWEDIESCRWGRFAPGNLQVGTRLRTKLSVGIPIPYRVQVEATLRRFGKWKVY